jgi:Flp pilus assembly pilin Flp
LLQQLVLSERGQDLVEYALLTAGIGLAGAATWPLITAGIGNTYQGLDTAAQELWEVPDPQ